jgi:hypothetical protein
MAVVVNEVAKANNGTDQVSDGAETASLEIVVLIVGSP